MVQKVFQSIVALIWILLINSTPLQAGVEKLIVTLSVTKIVALKSIDPASPQFDPTAHQVRLTFKNDESYVLTLPALAIARSVTRSYRNLDTGKTQHFTQGEPPAATPELLELVTGESWSYELGFELPDQVMTRNADTTLEICAIWEKTWLDPTIYPTGSYGWAQSFAVCHNARIKP